MYRGNLSNCNKDVLIKEFKELKQLIQNGKKVINESLKCIEYRLEKEIEKLNKWGEINVNKRIVIRKRF